jgi:hypothetical protein
LTEHVHVHCVVTGGGLSLDGTQWYACHRRLLFAVKALGAVFRGKYRAGLEQLRSQPRLTVAGASAVWAEEAAWNSLRQQLYAKPWVVYANPPWGSPEQVLKYLSRFLLHVVPAGFVRIRHSGLLANRTRHAKLNRVRQLLALVAATPLLSPVSEPATDTTPSPIPAARCPRCAGTHWRRITRLLPQRGLPP